MSGSSDARTLQNQDIHSEHSENPPRNPLAGIESEIRNLMKRCGSLTRDLEEAKQQGEKGARKMLLEFVAVADAFENVFRNIRPKMDSADPQARLWVDNFDTVYELHKRAMEAAGITPVEAIVGEKVNPHWHNVFEVVENPGLKNGTITEEIKKGYIWRGKLLRAAEVKAVKNPS